jgi:hypothetical protein
VTKPATIFAALDTDARADRFRRRAEEATATVATDEVTAETELVTTTE